ncbi:MAG: MarR family transcriptional regulator [Caulobacterales bacterium]
MALIQSLEIATRKAGALGARLDATIGSLLDVNDTDLRCLDMLNVRGAVSAGALAEELGLTTGAVTTVIDRLERAGYAVRRRSEHDRRTVLIALSPAAAPRISAFFAALQKEMDKALSDNSDTEIHFLISFFTRMQDATQRSITKLKRRV